MSIENVSNLLKKYLKITPPSDSIRRATINSIKKETGIELGRDKVKFIKGTVYLDTTPSARSKIILNKEKILQNIIDHVGEKKVSSLR